MRKRTIWMLACAVLLVGGCGSAGTFANKSRPATLINLTVYINNQRVSVSPGRVGAGPVEFIITNQSPHSESMLVQSASGGTLGNSGPINPGATQTLKVNVRTGEYTIATRTSASSNLVASITPATLHIGHSRPPANNDLLQP